MVKIALLMAAGDDAPADPVTYASRETALDLGEPPCLVALFRLAGRDVSSVLVTAAAFYEYAKRYDAVLVAGSLCRDGTVRPRLERASRLLEFTRGYGNVVIAPEER